MDCKQGGWGLCRSAEATDFVVVNVPQARSRAIKKPGSGPGFLGLRHLDSTTLWPTKRVGVQYLCVADIGNARIIIEKLGCDLI